MTPAGLAEACGGTLRTEHGLVTVTVAVAEWVRAATAARDDLGCELLDWLGAVDDGPDGVRVVLQVRSLTDGLHLALHTRLDPQAPALPSLAGVWAGAVWSEREVSEMFGVALPDSPDPRPLLLPDGFHGHPLRADFVLAARVARPWPGAKEPGEGAGDRPPRRRARPLGVPADGWGAP